MQGDFASDDNPKKETARMMLSMAREINAKFPDGKRHVSCYTCHRGTKSQPPNLPLPTAVVSYRESSARGTNFSLTTGAHGYQEPVSAFQFLSPSQPFTVTSSAGRLHATQSWKLV